MLIRQGRLISLLFSPKKITPSKIEGEPAKTMLSVKSPGFPEESLAAVSAASSPAVFPADWEQDR
jgi:hypothetical protein